MMLIDTPNKALSVGFFVKSKYKAMKHHISETRAEYEDLYHGNFSRALADWAIKRMKVKDAQSGKLEQLKATPFDQTMEIIAAENVKIEKAHQYTAWYLYNMAKADYTKTLTTDTLRATYVHETIYDPDSCPEAVLECFTAKMCANGVVIFWEDFL